MAVYTNGGSAPSPWSSFSWYDKVKNAFGGIPEYIWGSIVGVESSGNVRALGDAGKSYGLFQIYTAGGLGDAYRDDPTKLFDPEVNARIAAKAMKPVYAEGKKAGLTGFALAEYVASHSGWPLQTGNMPASYRAMLHTQYDTKYAGSGAPVAGSPAPTPVPAPAPAPAPAGGDGINIAGKSIFAALDEIERKEFSILSPAESTRKLSVLVLLVLLGLVLIGVGLVTFVGLGQSARIVAGAATGGESEAILAAADAAGATGENKEAKPD